MANQETRKAGRASSSDRFLVDIHHHIIPPRYAEVAGSGFRSRNPATAEGVLGWTPAKSVDAMDEHGIGAAVTSISTPGVWFGERELARHLARECNEFAARMAQDYPGRFGFFATLPLPDVEGALEEIRYAFDVLGADGVGVMSSYGRVWLGDPAFVPVLDELNRRHGIVYVHPILPQACAGMMPGVGEGVLEYLFDTARAVASLIYAGTLLRSPDIKFVFPHCGGALPPMVERLSRMADRDRRISPETAAGSKAEIQRLYFDVATSTNPVTLAALIRLVPATQIMLGTDYPFMPDMAYTMDPLRRSELSPAEVQAIEDGNALRLFPRFSESAGARARGSR